MTRHRADRLIGWREWAALPDLTVDRIKVKIDTGALSSSLHAWNVRPFVRDEREWLRFALHPMQRNDKFVVVAEAPLLSHRDVRSSNGAIERRPVITTTLALGDILFPIEVTLTRRDQMGFRMLLGRSALRSHFVIDPGRSFLGGVPISPTRSPRKGILEHPSGGRA